MESAELLSTPKIVAAAETPNEPKDAGSAEDRTEPTAMEVDTIAPMATSPIASPEAIPVDSDPYLLTASPPRVAPPKETASPSAPQADVKPAATDPYLNGGSISGPSCVRAPPQPPH